VVQQNAAMVEQSTAASHSLKAEAGDLRNLMTTFQLTNSAEVKARLSAPAHRATPASRPSPAPARKAAPAPRYATAGNTALAAPADDGWEEF
jgi:methyl-accepting chemotaxis protein